MSLVLRAEVQPILNKHNLPEFHAGIVNKHPVIVGECGQPLFTLFGVEFARSVPTVREIEIAVRLIDTFITTHSKSIDALLLARANKVKTTKTYDDLLEKSVGYVKHSHANTFTFSNGPAKFTVYRDKGTVTTLVELRCEITPTTAKSVIKLTKAQVTTATKLLEAYENMLEAGTAEREASNHLNACGV